MTWPSSMSFNASTRQRVDALTHLDELVSSLRKLILKCDERDLLSRELLLSNTRHGASRSDDEWKNVRSVLARVWISPELRYHVM